MFMLYVTVNLKLSYKVSGFKIKVKIMLIICMSSLLKSNKYFYLESSIAFKISLSDIGE